MDYDLYHDESKESGYWHGMLLVPHSKKQFLLRILENSRKNIGYSHPVNFKGVDKSTGKLFSINYSWLSIGVSAIAQKQGKEPLGFFNGKNFNNRLGKIQSEYEILKDIIGAKFIVMRVRDSHKSIDSTFFPDHASKIETTLRMGLKGGLHLLSNESDVMNIKSLHFDGYEHYGRNIDMSRIVGRINPLREHCSIDKNVNIDDRTSNHTKENPQSYEDCQLLQLTDLLIGAFRTTLGECKNPHQAKLSTPVNELINKWKSGKVRMRNSRWSRGFCLSSCWLENGEWNFDNAIDENNHSGQLELGL